MYFSIGLYLPNVINVNIFGHQQLVLISIMKQDVQSVGNLKERRKYHFFLEKTT